MLVIEDWEVYAFIFSFIGVIISLMFYLLYKTFGEPNLLQVAKEEMDYAITTVFLVIIILILVGSQNILTNSLNGMTRGFVIDIMGNNVYQVHLPVDADLTDLVRIEIENTKEIYLSGGFLSMAYYMGIFIYPLSTFTEDAFMSEVTSGGGFRPVADLLSNIFKMSAFYTWVYYILIQILYFIKYYWGVLLTLGIILRAFAPTRGAGAYLIALSLGLYLIFPLSYLIGSYTAIQFMKTNAALFSGVSASNIAPDIFGNGKGNCAIQQAKYDTPSLSVGWIYEAKKKVESKGFLDKIRDTLNTYNYWASFLFSMMCMLPLVALVITLTFVLGGTELFGGSIPEVSRGIVRLI